MGEIVAYLAEEIAWDEGYGQIACYTVPRDSEPCITVAFHIGAHGCCRNLYYLEFYQFQDPWKFQDWIDCALRKMARDLFAKHGKKAEPSGVPFTVLSWNAPDPWSQDRRPKYLAEIPWEEA